MKTEKAIILLLEDNQKLLDLNRRILEREGLIVLSARSIAEARERVKIAIPDVAVLDIMLPDGSGLDFLAELRGICGAPALILTAKTERADIIAGLVAGGNDYITKPYDIDEFRARVLGFIWLVNTVRAKKNPSTQVSSVLTEKELAITIYASEGLSNKDIAAKVFLSESRVKTCLSGIYRKLGISNKKDKRSLLSEILNT